MVRSSTDYASLLGQGANDNDCHFEPVLALTDASLSYKPGPATHGAVSGALLDKLAVDDHATVAELDSGELAPAVVPTSNSTRDEARKSGLGSREVLLGALILAVGTVEAAASFNSDNDNAGDETVDALPALVRTGDFATEPSAAMGAQNDIALAGVAVATVATADTSETDEAALQVETASKPETAHYIGQIDAGHDEPNQIAAAPATEEAYQYGGDGDDVLTGGAGNDWLYGGAGDDMLAGGEGDDVLAGGSGDDDLAGDAGDDHLIGGTGIDHLDGGEGFDVLVAGANKAQAQIVIAEAMARLGLALDPKYAPLSDGTAAERSLVLSTVGGSVDTKVSLVVENSDATLTVSIDAQSVDCDLTVSISKSGNSVLIGGDDSDLIIGGAGNDWLFGDMEFDAALAAAFLEHAHSNSSQGSSNNSGSGNSGSGNSGSGNSGSGNSGSGNSGSGNSGSGNSSSGNSGSSSNPFVLSAEVPDSSGSDGLVQTNSLLADLALVELLGSASAPMIFIDAVEPMGDSIVVGSSKKDLLFGTDGGDDSISGGHGHDTIFGGGGDDFLSGGSGNDSFVFNWGSGRDTIVDFEHGDTIYFAGVAPDYDALDAITYQIGDDVVIRVTDADQIVLTNVDKMSLALNDQFVFI